MSIGCWSEWRKLPVTLTELCINTTLRCGQTFRWRRTAEDEWSCTLQGRIVSLRQDATHLHYRSFPSHFNAGDISKSDNTEALIYHYFDLATNLSDLYGQWALADVNFKRKALHFTGIRILRQDAWETLVSFICSSNNNITRISQMVEKLCADYGPLIGHIDEKPYHGFPSPSALTGTGVESRLRELGFGYRAKYIYRTALMVANERKPGWLDSLRNPMRPAFGQLHTEDLPADEVIEYRQAHEKLLELQGVGPKVADCICLMGLGWGEAVPVDTHVWQIAQRDYKFGKGKQKSLTKATYDAVGDHFRKLWGKEAGWAHSVLFTADLKTFSDRLNTAKDIKKELLHIKEEFDGELLTKSEPGNLASLKRELTEDPEDDKTSMVDSAASTTTTKRRRTRRR
ncbi:8-oxoguanine glycosylase ogg1 [Ophidiomyces ophidiicola]|nr:8-oxoguanine glycosylase ogg1 [Ophidiomyces ophidiicola]KAI1963489.1 8-oxoguanine glycosylase ogg1 [Ophidiomyces ophidiicola]